jgi:DNA-binding NarL/FixJ family response regulator
VAWALVGDLFFRARVEGLAGGEGWQVRCFSQPADLLAALDGATGDTTGDVARDATGAVAGDAPGQAPELLIADLGAPEEAGFVLLEALQGRRDRSGIRVPPVLAFYSHVDDAARRRALALGADRVVPRSAFVSRFGRWVSELTAR